MRLSLQGNEVGKEGAIALARAIKEGGLSAPEGRFQIKGPPFVLAVRLSTRKGTNP